MTSSQPARTQPPKHEPGPGRDIALIRHTLRSAAQFFEPGTSSYDLILDSLDALRNLESSLKVLSAAVEQR